MTQAQLLTAINTSNAGGLPAGMQAAVITGGRLVLESVNADTQITINSSSPLMLAELGISTGTVDPTNLLTQGAVGTNQTLTIKISNDTASFAQLSVQFGNGGAKRFDEWLNCKPRWRARGRHRECHGSEQAT